MVSKLLTELKMSVKCCDTCSRHLDDYYSATAFATMELLVVIPVILALPFTLILSQYGTKKY